MNWAEWAPRLSRFYGLSVAEIVAMPVRLLYGYLEMYSRLTAEEALTGVNVTALGAGHIRKEDHAKAIRRLETAARSTPSERQRTTPQEARAMAARLGFL